jgi:hypothetical protein
MAFSFSVSFFLFPFVFLLVPATLPLVPATLPLVPATFQFATIGDWGGASLGGYHLKNVQQTAAAVAALDPGPAFVVNTGDSFYYCGIQNISDPQIAEDYTKVFGGGGGGGGGGRGAPLLLWYSVLGNHDYGFAPEAQLELGKVIPGWVMDARYYWRRIPIPVSGADAGAVINLIALDTSPCVNDYREDDPVKWDPCGKEFPTCAPQPGRCRFHENVLAQACEPQVAWLAAVLDEIRAKAIGTTGTTEWTIVVGHHRADELEFPARQYPFQALLDRPDVHLYLNGHVHSLEHYAINAQAKYVTSGAASMVVEEVEEEEVVEGRGLGGRGGRGRGMGRNAVSRVWSRMATGYTLHAVNSTALTTEFRDAHTNKVIHAFTFTFRK